MSKRLVAVAVWATTLGYFTCSANPFQWNVSSFQFNLHANYADLFLMDIHLRRMDWVVPKLGHFTGFVVMDLLLYSLVRRKWLAAFLAVLFAISTETFQLYFARDGRLYDMAIDSLGVLTSCLIQSVVCGAKTRPKATSMETTAQHE